MKCLIKIGVQCLSILFSILLVSCNSSSNKPQETPKQSQQTESTGQVVDNYVNRLTTAPDKAKKAVDAENARVEEINRAVQEMEKE